MAEPLVKKGRTSRMNIIVFTPSYAENRTSSTEGWMKVMKGLEESKEDGTQELDLSSENH